MYDYTGHLQKFGFEWNHTGIGFRYRIEINNNKPKKFFFFQKQQVKIFKLIQLEFRIWMYIRKKMIKKIYLKKE